MSTVSRVISDGCMSHMIWVYQGQPIWWVRIETGTNREYLRIPSSRGDEKLDVTVNVGPGTKVWIGVGWCRGSVRETITTLPAYYQR